MATKKAKGALSSEKRHKKSEEAPTEELLKDESLVKFEQQGQDELSGEEREVECKTPPEIQIQREPSPELVYEEPVLTKIIVETYEGEKLKGLYHGEGEAHFTGGHHYKGDFAEGMMHGNGRFTWSHNLVYDGQFDRNRVTGKGKYVWSDGSTYEGDVWNGLRNGFGTFVCSNGHMSYTGQWKNGKRNGKGRIDYTADSTSFYDGDWVNNVKHGFGTRQYPSQNIYEGMWFNNMRHGEGTMRWLNQNQMYTGEWENGTQHGFGQHIWFLQRTGSSQYPMRNMYEGEFDHGLRSGFGTFHYANGACYIGQWKDNMKHGNGKFIFKNGRVYEGVFEKDHIVEFPSFTMDSVTTPDLSQIRTRTPLQSEQLSIASNESRNTYGPSFQLEVEALLQEFAELDREEEAAQVIFVIMRYMSNLRKIYTFYSQLGYEESPDNTFLMSRIQFWRFLKDCKLHHTGVTIAEMNRVLGSPYSQDEVHSPYTKILFRQFLNNLVTLSWHLYHEEHEETSPVLAWCMSKLIADNILPHACSVQGYIYTEPRRATNALVHMDKAYEIYKSWLVPRKHEPKEPILKMRQFLFLMKDLKLINNDLTAKEIVGALAVDDPNVADPDGAINLEIEMTFLEFFEALVGCAQVYVTESVIKDPSTPRPSTTLTQGGQTIVSGTGSASQASVEAEEDDNMSGTPAPGISGSGTPVPRVTSPNTRKTDASSARDQENQPSEMTVASGASETALASHRESAKKSDMMLSDQKKSASFVSSHSAVTEGEQVMVQSYVSIGAHSEIIDDQALGDLEEEEEELDEATRQFNFWTYQLHIFFVRKFFPAAQRMLILKKLIEERDKAEKNTVKNDVPEPRSCSQQSDSGNKIEGNGDNGELADIVEQPEAEVVAAH